MRRIVVGLGVALLLGVTMVAPAWAKGTNLKSQTPRTADLPSGWATEATVSGLAAGCGNARTILLAAHPVNHLERDYRSVSGPGFQDTLFSYPTAAKAKAAWSEATRRLDHCRSYTTAKPKRRVTVGQLSMPTYGDRSAAWSMTGTGKGTGSTEALVLTEIGPRVAELGYIATGPVDLHSAQTLVATAVRRAAGVTRTPTPAATTVPSTAPPTTAPAPSTTVYVPPTTAYVPPTTPYVPPTEAAPPPATCTPLSSGGNCYEPGEFCSAADHGMSGVAGDGEAIVCADNNGWRWEPA